MKRRTPKHSADSVDGATSQDSGESRALGRRGLLTHGGALVVGAAAAGVAVAATSTPAGAATGDPVLVGDTTAVSTDAATEIDAANNSGAPTLILSNSGSPASGEASPSLRLAPAASTLVLPPAGTVGGDMVATGDGYLWFTHEFSGTRIPAFVQTAATSNGYVPLPAPVRILDTRSVAGRAHILDAAGNLDAIGRLLVGHTIHVDLTSLVLGGDGVTANLTVTGSAGSGYLTLWSGGVARPAASSINYAQGQTIANLSSVGIAEFTTSAGTLKTDTIAIACPQGTTHVVLDVAGFYVPDFAQVRVPLASTMHSATRAQRVMQARAQLKA